MFSEHVEQSFVTFDVQIITKLAKRVTHRPFAVVNRIASLTDVSRFFLNQYAAAYKFALEYNYMNNTKHFIKI